MFYLSIDQACLSRLTLCIASTSSYKLATHSCAITTTRVEHWAILFKVIAAVSWNNLNRQNQSFGRKVRRRRKKISSCVTVPCSIQVASQKHSPAFVQQFPTQESDIKPWSKHSSLQSSQQSPQDSHRLCNKMTPSEGRAECWIREGEGEGEREKEKKRGLSAIHTHRRNKSH